MNIDYTVQIWKEGNQYVAHAMPLDVMSAGSTPENAKKALEEAVHLFLETARYMGTLDDILEECGYSVKPNQWTSPLPVVFEKQTLALGF